MYSKEFKNMKYSFLIVFFSLSILKSEVLSTKIENKILGYFSSQAVRNFQDVWQKTRKGYESSVGLSLKESYSASGGSVNVYVMQDNNPQELCDGYYIDDNVVRMVLIHMYLREMPQLLMPDVSLSLASNVLRLETKLSKIFIDAEYALMRNLSDIVYEGNTDLYQNSPFVLQQVHTSGHVTIIAEDCHLIGEAVVTLIGVTPHVGFSMFRVVDCKFSIEISEPGAPSPPVIAPYFSKQQSDQLQNLLSHSISSDITTKLLGVMVSLINTTAVFGDEMVKFRSAQKTIFKETESYMQWLVRQLNKETIQENQGVVGMDDLETNWNDGTTYDQEYPVLLKISSVTMNGLDMAFPSLRGGPIKMATTMIVDEIRYYRLQVRGKFEFEYSNSKGVYDFFAELHDVPVQIQINIDKRDPKKNKSTKKLEKIEVLRWREIIFTTGNPRKIKGRLFSFYILGYLIHEVPKTITKHLENVFEKAINAEEDLKNELDQNDYEVNKKYKRLRVSSNSSSADSD